MITQKNNYIISEKLYEYINSVSLRECDILKQLRKQTVSLGQDVSIMQISPDQGQFMSMLISLMAAVKVIEIGTFTGYSTLCMAKSLPADGEIVACDISYEWTQIAKKYWRLAGVDNKIDLRVKPALETLDELLANGQKNSFDFVFIDADKTTYEQYYEKSLELIRSKGLIVIDNVLWEGKLIDESINDETTAYIRQFNKKIHQDSRVDISMLTIADGLFLVQKK